jgi:ATP-dependent DNA helicase DinG
VEGSAEGARKNITLVDARLDISKYLRDLLFLSKKTVTLCSATLTSSQNFSFLRKQIGLVGEDFDGRVEEKVYESPFDFEKNSLFLVPQDFPLPHEYSFLERSVALLKKIIQASKGGCFLLFTSYDMLQKCYDKIVLSSDAPPFQYLKQGEAPRHLLVEKFKKRSNSVLFATSSFWEGIDIAGDALRCVVITKLPFRVPTDPLFRSMSEMYEKEGKDPFREYSLPQASLKFKQGFGRLIRTKEDRGCVICLDGRVMKKSYGKVFLRGLPPCPIIYKDETSMVEEIKRFYQGNGA